MSFNMDFQIKRTSLRVNGLIITDLSEISILSEYRVDLQEPDTFKTRQSRTKLLEIEE